MAAMAPNVGELTGGQREALWDRLRPFIEKLYIEENRPLKDVMREVKKKYFFVATKSQYETRFKRWGLSKYVSNKAWLYIDYQLEMRRREGKPKTEVVLSGKPMSPRRIEKARRRNCGGRTTWETLALIPRPATPEDVEMLIRTPPSSQSHMSRELPWIEFMDQYGAALNSFSRMTLSPTASNATAMGLSTSLGPELPSKILPGKRSWHAFQKDFMPPVPVFGSANMDRQLWNSHRYIGGDMALSPVSDLQGLFFALSNNLSSNTEDSRQTIIDLFKASRLPVSTLRSLYKSGLVSIKASLDRLFEYAIMTLDVEVTRKLLQAGASPFREFNLQPGDFDKNNPFRQSIIKLPDRPYVRMTAFMVALAAGHWDLINLLQQDGGAEHSPGELENKMIFQQGWYRLTTLSCTVLACGRNPEVGLQMLRHHLAHDPKPSYGELFDCLKISVRVKDPVSAGILLDELFSRREFGLSQPPPEMLRAALLAGDDTKTMRIVGLGPDDCSLASAVRADNRELVRLLLHQGVDVHAGCPSPLQAAAFSGQRDILEMLISAGGDVNHIQHRLSGTSPHEGEYGFDEAQQQWFGNSPMDGGTGFSLGFTALGAAIVADDEEMIETLLGYGAIPCQADLTSAIEEGITKFVHDHIDAGGRVTWPVGAVTTPLAASLLAGHISLAEKILQADTSQYDPAAIVTGIFMASRPGVMGMVRELLRRRRGYYERHHPEGLSKIIHRCWEGMALSAAAMMGGCIAGGHELVQALLDCGIRPDVSTKPFFHRQGDIFDVRVVLNRMSAFHCHPAIQSQVLDDSARRMYWHTHCSMWAPASRDMGVVKLLWPEDEFAWTTCLERAIFLRWRELITSLLDEGKNKDYRLEPVVRGPSNFVSDPFLTSAASVGDLEVVRILVDAGADVNAAGRSHTALSAAVARGADDVVDFLLERGADVNAYAYRGGHESTALRCACAKGKPSLVRRLLDLGARPDERDSPFTPLCAAAANGRLDVLQVLLNAGALSTFSEAEVRVEYVRAIKLALSQDQNAAAELLKENFGEWGVEEEVLLRSPVPKADCEGGVPWTFDDLLEDWRDVIEDGGWEAPGSPPGMAPFTSSDPDSPSSDEEQGEMSAIGIAAVLKKNIRGGEEEGGQGDGAVEFTEWLAQQPDFYNTGAGGEDVFSLSGYPDQPGYFEFQEFNDPFLGIWS